jgi:predicted nucleic acid-binding Zn ribbon protein
METPETSADLMNQVLARLGGTGRALEFRVFEAYNGAVGEMLRARTSPERLNGKTLQVRVASSALAHELTMLRHDVLARIAREVGDDVVTDLRTRVGG